MSDKPIYYGAHVVAPKGSRFASMKEAAEAGQIRRFGIYKIDRKTLELVKEEKLRDKTHELLMVNLAVLLGKQKNLSSKIKFEKNSAEKAKLEHQLAKVLKSKELVKSKLEAHKNQNK